MAKLTDYGLIDALKPLGGGWRYLQPMPDASFHRIPSQGSANTGRDLVRMVTDFRIANGILPGDPAYDVASYIAKVSPINDRYKGKGVLLGKPRPPGWLPMIQRIRDWVGELSPKRPRTLNKLEANERAAICMACQQNIAWKTKCGECNKQVDYLAFNMRGVVDYELDDALHGCRLHGVHLPSAVFIDQDSLPSRVPEAPENCWMPIPAPTQ